MERSFSYSKKVSPLSAVEEIVGDFFGPEILPEQPVQRKEIEIPYLGAQMCIFGYDFIPSGEQGRAALRWLDEEARAILAHRDEIGYVGDEKIRITQIPPKFLSQLAILKKAIISTEIFYPIHCIVGNVKLIKSNTITTRIIDKTVEEKNRAGKWECTEINIAPEYVRRVLRRPLSN